MSTRRLQETEVRLKLYRIPGVSAPFAPWRREERGQQIYVKLSRGEEIAYLYSGSHAVLSAEVNKALMRLVNEGWKVEGEMTLSFDGHAEPGVDPYVFQDPLVLELGQALLPLVDPEHNAPLLEQLGAVRDEVARETGLVVGGVRVKDNLQLEPNQYLVRVKDSPVAVGELYLDRLLAVGSHEQLGELEGWATVEPAYRMKAKWIEADQKDRAQEAGCMLLVPLAVLFTHLRQIMLMSGPELLGLQETYNLVERLRGTHPVVVEDFLENRTNLRRLRKVLQALLSEGVPIRDLVTILETAGDMLDRLDRVELVVEFCRQALARQICRRLLDREGVLRGIALSEAAEQKLLAAMDESSGRLSLRPEEVEAFVKGVRQALEEASNPPVLFTNPPTRHWVRRLLARPIPQLSVLSNLEIAPGIRVQVLGQADFAKADSEEQEQPSREQRREGVLGFFKG